MRNGTRAWPRGCGLWMTDCRIDVLGGGCGRGWQQGAAGQWRSSIPGVSQRDGAPASLGLRPGAQRRGEAGARQGRGRIVARPVPDAEGRSLLASTGPRGARPHGGARHRPGGRRRCRPAAGSGIRLGVGGRVWSSVVGGTGRSGGRRVRGPGARWPRAGCRAERDGFEQGPPGGPETGDVLSAEPPDWWAVLAELDARRVRTLTQLAPALLADYAQPGSAAWEEDAALVADLRGAGLRPRGWPPGSWRWRRPRARTGRRGCRSSTSAPATPWSMTGVGGRESCRQRRSVGGL